MKRKLLLRAAEVLAQIPKRRFDLDQWIRGDAEQCLLDHKKVTKQAKCGTVACAGGWLGVTKEFNEVGLKFETNGFGPYAHAELTYRKKDSDLVTTDPFEALEAVFDLTEDQAEALFTSSGHGNYDDAIYAKHGEDISDRDLFQYRVKKVINAAKKQKGHK